ncbi:hypothetical protein ACTFIZ_008392 [Dictyostelium cf. discoideum]
MYQPRINNNYILYPASPPLLSECFSVSYPPPPFLNCNNTSNNSSPINSPKSFNNNGNNFNITNVNNYNFNNNSNNSGSSSSSSSGGSSGTPPSPIQIPIICTTTIIVNQSSPQPLPIQYPQIQLEKFNLSPNSNLSNQLSDHFNNNNNQKKKHRLSWKEIKKDFNIKHEIEKEKKKWKKFEEKIKEELTKDKIKMKKNEIKMKKDLEIENWKKIEIKFKSFYSEAEWKSFETKYRDQLNPELLDTILDLIF